MCSININNEYENILFKTNFLNKNSIQLGKDREHLFYFVCIPIRLMILFFLLFLSKVENQNIQTITTISLFFIYLFSVIHLLSKKNKCQWWSNEYEIVLCLLALLTLLFIKKNSVLLISLIMFFSIMGGIAQHLYLRPFKR
jgi:hypothetical protein